MAVDQMYNQHEANLRKVHRETMQDPLRGGSPALIEKATAVFQTNVWQSYIERTWISAVRPYYKCWPSISAALLKMRFDVPCEHLSLPTPIVCLRLPHGEQGTGVRAILVSISPNDKGEGYRNFLVASQSVLATSANSEPVISSVHIVLRPGTSIEESLTRARHFDTFESVDPRREEDEAYGVDGLRLAVAVCLLAQDPALVLPDVLNRDKAKLDGASAEDLAKFTDRARSNGKYGWNIGENYEAMPHYRRPHLALRHTGPGGKVPRIVPVKGSIVHRSKMTQVPTGHILPDGTELEP
jgi:hypothetical protein